MNNNKDNTDVPKSLPHIIVQLIEYLPNAVVSRTVLKKITGNVTASSLAEGEEVAEKLSPYDVYVQIIDGQADITIDKKNYMLKLGEGIIIPAHATHHFSAKEQFKMLSTVIKSGYED